PLAWTPLVLILMNLVYAAAAYPLGALADRLPHRRLLAWGLGLLLLADLMLAAADQGPLLWGGVLVWGLHMAMTQGLLAAMVAASAPANRRGTAFGLYNLASGVALLVGSGLAGWLWDRYGAAASFGAGAVLCLVALAGLALLRPAAPPRPDR
ncbi:MAG: MFS transporter, partial [Rhodoferax sp.]|nr:MFS transporter [Rhodoferax sp.]